MRDQSERGSERTLGDVFSDLLGQVTGLLRTETRLARVEVGEKISQAAHGLIYMIAGAALVIPALTILLSAAAAALVDAGMVPAAAALIIGGITLAAGVGIILAGLNRLKPANLAPQKTIDQLEQDVSLARK